MCHKKEFNWEAFIYMVDNKSSRPPKTQFTDLEKFFLKCYHCGMSEEKIIETLDKNRTKFKYYYNSKYYFSGGFKPNIMGKLSQLIDEPVNKKNFFQVFQRRYEEDNQTNF